MALRLFEQPAERGGGGCLVGARLPEAALLAGDRIGSGVDADAERAAGQPLNVAAPGLGQDGTITRSGVSVPRFVPRQLFDSFELSL